MTSLIAACAYFLFIHFAISGTRWRDALVARLGEQPYRGAFSLASLAGLGWMVYAYRRAPTIPLWGMNLGLRPLVFAVVFVAVLFVVIGLSSPGPTSVGAEGKLAQGEAAVRGITRITRHPFLWGIALWAFAHLLVNGDVASVVLFGTLLLLALAGTAAIDGKRSRRFGEQWQQFAAHTSNVPFAAMVSGRNSLAPALAEIGLARPAIAVVVYALLFVLHGPVIGAPLR
jgi:uncharacterized membrane protein